MHFKPRIPQFFVAIKLKMIVKWQSYTYLQSYRLLRICLSRQTDACCFLSSHLRMCAPRGRTILCSFKQHVSMFFNCSHVLWRSSSCYKWYLFNSEVRGERLLVEARTSLPTSEDGSATGPSFSHTSTRSPTFVLTSSSIPHVLCLDQILTETSANDVCRCSILALMKFHLLV